MEELTNEQITAIADGYRNVARALNEFQTVHWPDFTHEQHLDLNAYQNSLLNRAHDLQSHTVRLAYQNPTDLTAGIQRATDAARNTLPRVGSLSVALTVGAIIVALASYVARTNLRGIQTAIGELADLLTMGD